MTHLSSPARGFADAVHDAQAAFRKLLDALARPGRRYPAGAAIPGLALGPAMAHLLLTLTDDDTPVWWQERNDTAAPAWLRFHTGASQAVNPVDAAFAVLAADSGLPSLADFAAGSTASPEHSATLLIEVPSLDDGPVVEWRGPGIQDVQAVGIAGLPKHFWTQWQHNHAAFPQGVDIVFTCLDEVIGLPRTTRVRRLEGI
ncbi:MAG: phosphonate metabolism [Polaromonas sp.]|nr:phosphonate metabolism [Polaromonas sp.]